MVELKNVIQDLSDNLKILNKNKGAVRVDDYPVLMESIRNYQLNVLHPIAERFVIDNERLMAIVANTRLIHELRNVPFEDEDLAEVLLDIFRTNISVLSKYGIGESLTHELEDRSVKEGDATENFNAMVHGHINSMINELNRKEQEKLDNLAKDSAESILLGCPVENVSRDLRSGEERLHDILESVHQEQIEKRERELQNLSLFDESKTLVGYREAKRKDLEETLIEVSNCLLRNNKKERLLSQGYQSDE